MLEHPSFDDNSQHETLDPFEAGTIRPVEEELAAISNPTQPDKMTDRHLEAFDPNDEVYDILSHPSGPERHRALAEYKGKLRDQLEALTHVQEVMVQTVESNPDISRDELLHMALEFRNQYGLSDFQMLRINELIDKFVEQHNTVRRIREQYPDDKELIKATFGFEPIGEVEIIEGPLTLDIVCKDAEDFAQLFFSEADRMITPQDIKFVQQIGGAFLTSTPKLMPELSRKIVLVNDSLFYSNIPDTIMHERRHAIDELFLSQARLDELPSWHAVEKAHGSKDVAAASRNFLLECSGIVLDQARNEILSQYKEHPGNRAILAEKIQTHYLELYFEHLRRHQLQWTTHFFEKHAGGFALQDTYAEIFSPELKAHIAHLVEKAVSSMQILERANWPVERILALLTSTPLDRWPQAVESVTFDEAKPSPLERKRVSHAPIERAEDV